MRVEQISVFLENKSGRLADVTFVLAEAGINIRVLSVADATDFGVLRMIVHDNKKAEDVLKNGGFAMRKTEVLAVEVEDKPGGLNKILVILQKAKINVEYMYALARQDKKNAIMIFRFDNLDEAARLLEENGVNVIDGNEVYAL
jgi:hypothetical protein